KQSLLAWAPLYCGFLLVWERSWKRAFGFGAAVTLGCCARLQPATARRDPCGLTRGRPGDPAPITACGPLHFLPCRSRGSNHGRGALVYANLVGDPHLRGDRSHRGIPLVPE